MVPIAKAGILTVLIGGGCVGTYALANGGFGSKRGNEETAKADASENKGQSTAEPARSEPEKNTEAEEPASDSGRSVEVSSEPNVVAPEVSAFEGEPAWKPLTKDSDYATKKTTDYKDRFGSIYGNYFVGLDETNKGWWDKAFKKLQSDSESANASLGEKFKYSSDVGNSPITKAFSNTLTEKGLNQICNEVYKSETKSITSVGDKDNYKESDVWKYCSPLGEKPKTLSSVARIVPPGGKAGATDNTTKFISTTGNNKFWEIRDKEFKGEGDFESIEEDSSDSFFKNNKNKKIRDLCKGIYESNFSTFEGSRPNDNTVLKYCSLEKR